MIVGPCHVGASPEITLDKKSEKRKLSELLRVKKGGGGSEGF